MFETSDYRSPGQVPLPNPKEMPEPRTPPLDDAEDEGPGGVPDLPEQPDDENTKLPDEVDPDQKRRDHGRGTPNEDQPGRQDRSTERGGDEQG